MGKTQRQKDIAEENLQEFLYIIPKLQKDGFDVRALSAYQFRIDGIVDIWPSSRKYWVVNTRETGHINDFAEFMQDFSLRTFD